MQTMLGQLCEFYFNFSVFSMKFSVSCYTTAATSESTFFFGGYGNNYHRVAKFTNNVWSEEGSMNSPRYGHGSITLGDQTMQISGYASGAQTTKTEVWRLSTGSNKIIDPELKSGYSNLNIGLFLVPLDYCSN